MCLSFSKSLKISVVSLGQWKIMCIYLDLHDDSVNILMRLERSFTLAILVILESQNNIAR